MSDHESSEEEQGREYQQGRDRGRVRKNPYSDTSSEEEETGDSGSERHMDSEKPTDSGDEQIAKVGTAP